MVGAEKARGVKRLQRADLARPLDGLADRDERGHVWMLWPERLRDHRSEVRHRHRLRRNVARVPVVLMPRMEDEAEVRGHERPDHRAAIHHAPDLLQPFGETDAVNRRRNRRERTEHVLDVHAPLERRVALGIECLGLRHAASHPEDDDRVRSGRLLRRVLREHRLPAHERRKRRPRRRPHEAASAELCVDETFFGSSSC